MDRFGYAKTIDVSAYDRNREAADKENKYVFKCMNTEKVCIFTDNGNLHQVKMADVPFVRFRDKGTPIDNLGNYDSKDENIVFVCHTSMISGRKLLFTTADGMMKLVDSEEFNVSKKTVMATKLAENDKLVSVVVTNAGGLSEVTMDYPEDDMGLSMLSGGSDDEGFMMPDEDFAFGMADSVESVIAGEMSAGEVITNEMVVLQTETGYFLRFSLSEIPEKKKAALGVKGIKLTDNDRVTNVYVMDAGDNMVIEYKEKELSLRKLKTARRGTKGTKVRV